MSFLVCGVLSSIVFSVGLDKYKFYLKGMRTLLFFAALFGAALFFTLPHDDIALACTNFAILGVFNCPVIPLGYAFSAELAYPVSDVLVFSIVQTSM